VQSLAACQRSTFLAFFSGGVVLLGLVLAAAGVAFFLDESSETSGIFAVVVINVVLAIGPEK
jgi:hypothetical protein